MEIAERLGEIKFILYGREEYALVGVVAQFKYLGHPLDQMYDNWPAVRRNVKRARKFWGVLENMLQREGANIKFSAMFYRVFFHAVILFGLESWVMFSATEKIVDGVHTGFMRQITGKRAQRNTGGMWVKLTAGEVM